MKHIQLFEEFTQLYINIKTIPRDGWFNGSKDEIGAIIQALTAFTLPYKCEHAETHPTCIKWRHISMLSPSNKKSFYVTGDNQLNPDEMQIEEFKFENYFTLKPEFRGHKLRKYNL